MNWIRTFISAYCCFPLFGSKAAHLAQALLDITALCRVRRFCSRSVIARIYPQLLVQFCYLALDITRRNRDPQSCPAHSLSAFSSWAFSSCASCGILWKRRPPSLSLWKPTMTWIGMPPPHRISPALLFFKYPLLHVFLASYR